MDNRTESNDYSTGRCVSMYTRRLQTNANALTKHKDDCPMTPVSLSLSMSMSRGNYLQCYENINSTTATTRIAQSTVSTSDGQRWGKGGTTKRKNERGVRSDNRSDSTDESRDGRRKTGKTTKTTAVVSADTKIREKREERREKREEKRETEEERGIVCTRREASDSWRLLWVGSSTCK